MVPVGVVIHFPMEILLNVILNHHGVLAVLLMDIVVFRMTTATVTAALTLGIQVSQYDNL